MKIICLFFCTVLFTSVYSQENEEIQGEIVFPLFNGYSGYGLDAELAAKILKAYEKSYVKAQKVNDLNDEMRLFAVIKKRELLFNPYVIVKDSMDREAIIYMDSATYQKTFVWNYNYEELRKKQSYLWFQGQTIPLGENAYWLTEFKGISLIQDSTRSMSVSKFALDVYRK